MSDQLTLEACQQATGGRLSDDENISFSGVSIDTRTLKPGDLYVAIKGPRFDGHDFVAAAIEAGALAVMVSESVDSSVPVLTVADTVEALGQLGRHWARRFSIPTIAITGSNGKTTVKEIITAILRQVGPVLSTQGNLNNELGVPLTLLKMRKEHLYAVIEMGANHVGEIARLVALAEPDVALVNNVGTAHLEGFGSVEGIAKGKSEIYAGLSADGYAVINADDDWADFMREAASHCKKREFGRAITAQVRGQLQSRLQGQSEYDLSIHTMGKILTPRFQLSGEHNATNALAAVAAVQCLDVQPQAIVNGLESVAAVPGRLQHKRGLHGMVVIDDSYNANPDSVRSAIRVLAQNAGRRFLVLGDMAELGQDQQVMHYDVGIYAARHAINGLFCCGNLSTHTFEGFGASTKEAAVGGWFDTQEALIEALESLAADDVTLLVKGSRSAHMERVVNALTLTDSPAAHESESERDAVQPHSVLSQPTLAGEHS